ncbi:hypothetical protein MED222_05820 [Vibrio sp. MED222]|nr:hypothetical protein MED222_05820 [Vibrio sp. MED222]
MLLCVEKFNGRLFGFKPISLFMNVSIFKSV